MTAPLLDARGLTRRYRLPRTAFLRAAPVLTAVENTSFTIRAGETLGIVGESGSGKSTLARMVMAFEAPDEGEVLFQGQNPHSLPAADLRHLRQQFQMVFQDRGLVHRRAAARHRSGWHDGTAHGTGA